MLQTFFIQNPWYGDQIVARAFNITDAVCLYNKVIANMEGFEEVILEGGGKQAEQFIVEMYATPMILLNAALVGLSGKKVVAFLDKSVEEIVNV